MALHVALSRELFLFGYFDSEVDVWCAAGVRHGLDRAKVVLASTVGQKPAEALEVSVSHFGVAGAGMQVRSVVIALPDFDGRIANRLAPRVEDTAGEMRNLADGGRDPVVDDEQIIVRVERQLIGIERPFGLS